MVATLLITVVFLLYKTSCEISYVINKYPLNFINHEALCLFQYDTTLASIHNATQNTEALSLCLETIGCFIGLNDISKQYTFVWTDSSVFNYGTNLSGGVYPWNIGEPNHFANNDCVTIQTEYSINSWDDALCIQNLYALCNYPTPIYLFKDNKNYQRIPKHNTIIATIDILDEIHIEFDIIVNAYHPEYVENYTNILQI
eukprot:475167_1